MDLKFPHNLPLSVRLKKLCKRRQRSAEFVYPHRQTGYVAFMRRIPWQWRLLALVTVIILLGWTGVISGVLMTNFMLFSGLLTFPEHTFSTHEQIDKIRNMPAMLHHEVRADGAVLRIGMEEAPLRVVKKVAISQRNQDYAFIDFPYTSRITSPLLFPIEQIETVRQWFADNTPEIEVIE